MKLDLLRLLATVAIGSGLLMMGTWACEEEVDVEEVQDAAEQAGNIKQLPSGENGKALDAKSDATADAESDTGAKEEAKAPELTGNEKAVIAALTSLSEILEGKCDKPKKCIKLVKKTLNKEAKALKKVVAKIKDPQEAFIAQCKELLEKRDAKLGEMKKVGKKVKGPLKKFDKVVKGICK